jgi:hypothetical protein
MQICCRCLLFTFSALCLIFLGEISLSVYHVDRKKSFFSVFIEACAQLFTSINICAHRSGFENKFGGLPERKEQQSGSFIARRATPAFSLDARGKKKTKHDH